MARAGLTPAIVADTAAAMLDADPGIEVTLARVAHELGVKPPSLYNHVDGVEALMRMVAVRGVDVLAEACRAAVMGRSGSEAFRALADAYRLYAVTHPGVYPLTQVARPGDADYEAAAGRLLEPVLALLGGFGFDDRDLVHAARAIRSALHGFSLLETGSGFGMEVDPQQSWRWMIEFVERGLEGWTR